MKHDINISFPCTSSSNAEGETASMLSVLLICMGIVFETANSFVTEDPSNFTVRLNNSFGNNSREGRLEIYYSGRWGTVCDDSFTNASAGVACASLGFGYIGAVIIANRHGAGTGQIWLDDVQCTGTEAGIKQCPHSAWGVHNCAHNEDVSIRCEDISNFTVRLNNSIGNNSREGRLEIYYSGRWGTVCKEGFTNASARVACASLGFGYIGVVIGNRHGAGTDQFWLYNVTCIGTERGIEQCVHNGWGVHKGGHDNSYDVSISCDCGVRHFSGLFGKISSPNFPSAYANNLDCYNYIRVTSEHTVVITFLTFNTQPSFDWVTITCESGNAVTSPRYSGFELPSVLIISSCNLVNVYFHTDGSSTHRGFSLTYSISSDSVIGGFTTKPSNAFPRTDKNVLIVFNCTTTTEYLPWWTINDKSPRNYTITNSTCGVITSAPHSPYFMTETLGPGSCNLIVIAPANSLYLLAGSVVCTDSTLSSTRAILAPIKLELKSTGGTNFLATVTDIIRDEVIKISCNPSFTYSYSSSSLFTYVLYSTGPVVQMRILRTYWTSQGTVVSSTNTSTTSSYLLIKAPNGVFPSYTCNIVCDFFSNISDIRTNSPIQISFSTELVEVLYWPTEDKMTIIGDNNGQIRTSALLNCYAAAYPPATYTWIDESSGEITNGPTIMINHGGKYTCNASNIIRGQYYQQSKSVNLHILEDQMPQLPVLTLGILLGLAFLTIITILAILLSRKYRQQKRNSAADVGHEFDGNDHELRQREGETNRYEDGFGIAADVDESEYDNLEASNRRRPAEPAIYQELKIKK